MDCIGKTIPKSCRECPHFFNDTYRIVKTTILCETTIKERPIECPLREDKEK